MTESTQPDSKTSLSDTKEAEARTPEQIRKSRNRVLGLGLAAFVVLVFFISIAKMG
ncbi:hypothetical protein EDF56_106402 [Novosphingobium sp. PhB165]|jgi:hypothetical protein|uniref:hypothetical protein n=1 Tax=Novosphingobium sp. PhB165 TaxID=2485105 RepID=UPI0010DAA8B9|nr:hypothetical protein [Novosphingobium sp. PhB165]TCM17285.1 hypothetical protein EDF56_106402 [Novosphingobium sp. PhB165]